MIKSINIIIFLGLLYLVFYPVFIYASELSIHLSRSRIKWGETITLEIEAMNPINEDIEGHIIVSFSSDVIILNKDKESKIYYKGTNVNTREIYSSEKDASLKSLDGCCIVTKHLMVKNSYHKWPAFRKKKMTLKLLPTATGINKIYMRAFFKNNEYLINIPNHPAYLDQQNYPVEEIRFLVDDSNNFSKNLKTIVKHPKISEYDDIIDTLETLLKHPKDIDSFFLMSDMMCEELNVCRFSHYFQMNGHIKMRSDTSWYSNDSLYRHVGAGPHYNGFAGIRINNKVFLSRKCYFEGAYEALISGGYTLQKKNELMTLYPYLFKSINTLNSPMDDSTRLMDLSASIQNESNIQYYRADRFSLTIQSGTKTFLSIGRQAVTWGNGFLFNPIDIFNPFSPTDIERDYKIGDDLLSIQTNLFDQINVHTLYVPRRNSDNKIEWKQSSLASKVHFSSGSTEFDIMLGYHYQDFVFGLGSSGYLGGTAWRINGLLSVLDDKNKSHKEYYSIVANIDYSWIWWHKNIYAFIELYYNNIGTNYLIDIDPNLIERIGRGELFTLGRYYLGGHVRIEFHPLFNFYLTIIDNLNDFSASIQPRGVWDIKENVQLSFGTNLACGKTDSEFGGFIVPGTKYINKPQNSVFLWLTYFF